MSAEAGESWHRGAALLVRIGSTAMLDGKIAEMRQVCAKAGVAELLEGDR